MQKKQPSSNLLERMKLSDSLLLTQTTITTVPKATLRKRLRARLKDAYGCSSALGCHAELN